MSGMSRLFTNQINVNGWVDLPFIFSLNRHICHIYGILKFCSFVVYIIAVFYIIVN